MTAKAPRLLAGISQRLRSRSGPSAVGVDRVLIRRSNADAVLFNNLLRIVDHGVGERLLNQRIGADKRGDLLGRWQQARPAPQRPRAVPGSTVVVGVLDVDDVGGGAAVCEADFVVNVTTTTVAAATNGDALQRRRDPPARGAAWAAGRRTAARRRGRASSALTAKAETNSPVHEGSTSTER